MTGAAQPYIAPKAIHRENRIWRGFRSFAVKKNFAVDALEPCRFASPSSATLNCAYAGASATLCFTMVSAEKIQQLLYENESSTLDFKREQYLFVGADDKTKSELLKDILAFANAWRRADAFILIGIEEVSGNRATVVGINSHVDDANLQQFVNSKTQRPIHFSYQALSVEGKQIGILTIPVQSRPFYLKVDFGKLQKNVVYIRRGSSTATASPDEIATMRDDEVLAPAIDLQFYDKSGGNALGNKIKAITNKLTVIDPHKIPDYGRMSLGGQFSVLSPTANRDYFRELIKFCQDVAFFAPIFFRVKNLGSVTAEDVRVEIQIPDESHNFEFGNYSDLPNQPSSDSFNLRGIHRIAGIHGYDIKAKKLSSLWQIELRVGKVQPQHTVLISDPLYVKSNQNCTLNLEALIYADNLPAPIKQSLVLQIDVTEVQMTCEDILTVVEDGKPQDGQANLFLQNIRNEFLA